MMNVKLGTILLLFCFYIAIIEACAPAKGPAQSTTSASLVEGVFLGTVETDWKDPFDAPGNGPAPAPTPLRVPDDASDGIPIGGLSGITSNAAGSAFYAISDDGEYPRYYRLSVDLDNNGKFDDFEFDDVEFLRDDTGNRLTFDYVDPEDIKIRPDNEQFFFWANEEAQAGGGALNLVEGDPSVHEAYIANGAHNRKFNNPTAFQGNGGTRGIREGSGFESLAVTPNGRKLIAIPSEPLIQDRFQTDKQTGLIRFPVWDPTSGSLDATNVYIYPIGPVPAGHESEIYGALALDNNRFLTLEYLDKPNDDSPSGFDILEFNMYEIDLSGATDVLIDTSILDNAVPVTKKLIKSCKGPCDPALPLQYYQGAAFITNNGDRSIVVVSDNDFERYLETQFLLFKLKEP